MHTRDIARYMDCWLNPLCILQSASRYEKDREKAVEPSMLALGSTTIESVSEAGLGLLVREVVTSFRLNEQLLELLRAMTGDYISDDTWHWLSALKFEGTIEDYVGEQTLLPQRILMLVHERDAIIDILSQPLNALAANLSHQAHTWGKMRSLLAEGGSAYLRHSSPEPFSVMTEAFVAESFGFEDAGKAGVKQYGTQFRYRAITVSGPHPMDERILEAGKLSSRDQAEETRKPLPVKRFLI